MGWGCFALGGHFGWYYCCILGFLGKGFGNVFTATVGLGEGREEMQATLSSDLRTRLQAAGSHFRLQLSTNIKHQELHHRRALSSKQKFSLSADSINPIFADDDPRYPVPVVASRAACSAPNTNMNHATQNNADNCPTPLYIMP